MTIEQCQSMCKDGSWGWLQHTAASGMACHNKKNQLAPQLEAPLAADEQLDVKHDVCGGTHECV